MKSQNQLKKIQEGYGTEQAPVYDDVLATDAVRPPEILKARGNYFPKVNSVPFRVYTDPEYAKREMEHIWKKCWQFACREEELPEVGDRCPYDVGALSFMIVRTGEDSFAAYDNFCLHRGTRLCHARGKVTSLRCPYHGWEWNLDGSRKNIPAQWDFPQIEGEACNLPQVKLERWGGCIFINPDPDAGPLADAMGIIPEHFKHFDMENRFTLMHTRKKVRANWKLLYEAFLESYHVIETHPQISSYIGDVNSRYDIFDDGKARIGRFMSPIGVPSPLYEGDVTPRDAAIELMETFVSTLDDGTLKFPDYDNDENFGRKDVAEWKRQMLKTKTGSDCSHLSDAEMLDGIQYEMFPNFSPWLGEGFAVIYQFRPLGDNPEESLFDVRMTMPIPPGAPRPPAAEVAELDFDTPYSSRPEWGAMCDVYDQDMSNIPLMQQGVKSALLRNENAASKLGVYQEQRCASLFEFTEEKINAARG